MNGVVCSCSNFATGLYDRRHALISNDKPTLYYKAKNILTIHSVFFIVAPQALLSIFMNCIVGVFTKYIQVFLSKAVQKSFNT